MYEVATGTGITLNEAILKLKNDVRRLIKYGYTYQGGISIAVMDNGRIIVCQAMRLNQEMRLKR